MKIISSATYSPDFAIRCWNTQKAYADRIGADFEVIIREAGENPANGHLDVIEGMSDDDLVMVLDWDIEVSNDAPDIKDYFTGEIALPIFNDSNCPFIRMQRRKFPLLADTEHYFNIGIMLGKVGDLNAVRRYFTQEIYDYMEGCPTLSIRYEAAVNLAIHKSGVSATPLPKGLHVYAPLQKGPFLHHVGPAKHKNNYSILHS